MIGQLFTQDFLSTGISDTPAWKAVTDAELDAFITDLKKIYVPFKASSNLNEPVTENEILVRVLVKLGWTDILTQQIASKTRREDVPDMLLLPTTAAKTAALKERREDRRYRHGIAILESKRWMRPLDRGDATDRMAPGTPSNQMLRYLSTVEVASERAIRWGMLSNGAVWRLYYQGARSRSEEFLELNVAGLLRVPGVQADLEFGADARHGVKLFYCLFQRNAFLIQAWDDERRTFHEYALAEARHYEDKVSQDLGSRVFGLVFPDLANALAAHDPRATKPYTRGYLDEVRESALILLYRLLFVLYAEDRLLLPVADPRYQEYSLSKLRDEVRDKRDSGGTFSKTATRIWDALKGLFASVATGDAAIGLPAYNGGLFENHHATILDHVRIPDEQMALILDELSRRVEDVSRYWINYRDLSVQQLGSIYERLLDYRLEQDGGRLVARPTSFARKTTGKLACVRFCSATETTRTDPKPIYC